MHRAPLNTKANIRSRPHHAKDSGEQLMLQLRNSFYGKEGHELTDKLATELPAILKLVSAGIRSAA